MLRFLMRVALSVTILAGLGIAAAAQKDGKKGRKVVSKQRTAGKIAFGSKLARPNLSKGKGNLSKGKGKVNINNSGNASGGTSVSGNRAGATNSAPGRPLDVFDAHRGKIK